MIKTLQALSLPNRISGTSNKPPTKINLNRITNMKTAALALALFAFSLTAGCKGFSFDASGFDAYVDQELDESSDRYSFTALDKVTSGAMEETANWLSVTNAERAASAAMGPTADRLSASELDRFMDKRFGDKASDWSVSELDRLFSKKVDVETMLRD